MSTKNDVNSSSEFYVRSGAICFGWPHNAEYGASQPVQVPALLAFKPFGTVYATRGLHHNFAAVNGKWRVFKIISTDKNGSSTTSAFFCCHESVQDPVAEVRRINRKAGSPYEKDSGDHKNTPATFENRITVINRYDWGYYDERNHDHASQFHILPEDCVCSACLVIDYASTVEVLATTNLATDDYRDLIGLQTNSSSEEEFVGMRLFLKSHEYGFGRFGLNETRTAVESFLFFSTYTEFDNCTLNGEPVKITRSFEQMVVEDGLQCDGFEMFASYRIEIVNNNPVQVLVEAKPPSDVRLRQFDDSLSIISVAEANAHLLKVGRTFSFLTPETTAQLKAPLEQKVIRLLNECLMTFLSSITDAVVTSQVQTSEQAEERFRQLAETEYASTSTSKLKVLIGEYFRKVKEPLPSISAEMDGRIKSFAEQNGVTLSASTLVSIQSAVNALITEIFELLCPAALDSGRTLVTPADVRRAIFYDPELLQIFQSCRIFWPPTTATTTAATSATNVPPMTTCSNE